MRSRWRIAVLLGVGMLPAAAVARHPDIYIPAGQSNMSGRGRIEDLTAAERTPSPAVRVYGNDGRWREAAEPIDDAAGQVDAVSADRLAGVGPGLFFARALRPRRPIALLPCAKGGSTIGQWAGGGGRDTLFGSCVTRAQGAGARVAGMLWYQGESDAQKPDAAGWGAAFDALVAGFRRDLNAPRLPVVLVRIADRVAPAGALDRFPSWTAIQRQQVTYAAPCVAIASAGGLARGADDLHLTTAAQRTLGLRLAAAMAGLRAQGCR